jgi:hypothetical protein
MAPAGRGRMSFTDVRDIAVAVAVIGREEHYGRAHMLTGGQALERFVRDHADLWRAEAAADRMAVAATTPYAETRP